MSALRRSEERRMLGRRLANFVGRRRFAPLVVAVVVVLLSASCSSALTASICRERTC